MTIEHLNKLDIRRALLPPPGDEVVGELIREIRKLRGHLELAHGLIRSALATIPEYQAWCKDWKDMNK